MASKKKPVLKQKTKKKKWFPIYAPSIFGSSLIGESHVESVELMKGKYINTNLSTIANDMKKQNMSVKLRVNKVVDGKGQTEIIGLSLVQSFVKRLVRRGRSKVDDSFIVRTKDGQLIRVKPLVLTNSTCVSSTASQIRLETRALLKEKIANTGFINIVQEILNFRLQKSIKEKMQKVHPIRSVDIRVFEREVIRGKVPEVDLQIVPEEEVRVEKAKEETTKNEETVTKETEETPVEKESPVKEEKAEETVSKDESEEKKE